MEIIERYFLYRPDGTEEIEVEKLDNDTNIVRTITGAHVSEESTEEADSEVNGFMAVCTGIYGSECGWVTTVFDREEGTGGRHRAWSGCTCVITETKIQKCRDI